jgi:lysophospholipase L1-like esterase
LHRRFAQNVLLVLLGLLLAVVTLELLLQGASFLLRNLGSRANVRSDSAERIILCVGDSHTYGAGVAESAAYPAQLERYLNEVDPEGRYAVLNRGVPGMNSAQVAHLLPALIGELRPSLVVVWAGINNSWNLEDPGGIRDPGSGRSWRSLAMRSRLYRLWLSLEFRSDLQSMSDREALAELLRPKVREQARRKARRLPKREFIEATVQDVLRIEEVLKDEGMPWILLTYPMQGGPWGVYGSVHARAVRAFAAQRHVALVDTMPVTMKAQEKHPDAVPVCEASELETHECLFVEAMGPHPTQLLYGYIAESIGRRVLSTLGCAGPCRIDPAPQQPHSPLPPEP